MRRSTNVIQRTRWSFEFAQTRASSGSVGDLWDDKRYRVPDGQYDHLCDVSRQPQVRAIELLLDTDEGL